MLILYVELLVQKEAPFSPEEATFKGSLFHGLIERAVSDHSLSLWRSLRRTPLEKALYALIPPLDGLTTYPAGHRFTLGIVLFGQAVALWHEVLDALMSCQRLGLGRAATPLLLQSASLHHPNHPPQTHLQAVSARNPLPLCRAPVVVPTAQSTDRLCIDLLSPTQINSRARRETLLPLTLSSVVKSLQQRLSALEPELAAPFEFDSPAWQDSVRAFWPHQIAAQHSIQDRAWVHQSRNTPGPMLKQAITGRMDFEGPVAAPVVQLLAIGQWLALGQSCSLGQGWYAVHTSDPANLAPPPLLSSTANPFTEAS